VPDSPPYACTENGSQPSLALGADAKAAIDVPPENSLGDSGVNQLTLTRLASNGRVQPALFVIAKRHHSANASKVRCLLPVTASTSPVTAAAEPALTAPQSTAIYCTALFWSPLSRFVADLFPEVIVA
jgi:hypothetical protein